MAELGSFSTSSDQAPKGVSVGRRGFLLLLGAVVAGEATGYTAATSAAAISQNPESIQTPRTKIYRSGDTIETPYTPVAIEGWRFLFDIEKMEEYQRNRSLYSTFVLTNLPQRTLPNAGAHGGTVAKVKGEGGRKYYRFTGSPRPTSITSEQFIYLTLVEEKLSTKTIEGLTTYPVLLDYHTYQPEDRFDRVRVYSEIDLSPQTFKEIHEQMRVFDKFAQTTYPAYIYKSDPNDLLGRSAVFNTTDGRIELSSASFTHPLFDNQGLAVLFHESSHGVLEDIIHDSRDLRDIIELYRAYEGLINAAAALDPDAGFRIPMPSFSLFGIPPRVRNNPFFSIFTESIYGENEDNKDMVYGHGHPVHNYNELFASTGAILRYFPEQFLQRFFALEPQQREVVREVPRAVFNALKHFRSRESVTSNEEALRELFPFYTEITAAISQ